MAKTFVDDCIAGYREDDRPPFKEAYLTITLCCDGGRVPDSLQVRLPNADTATHQIFDDDKLLELLRLIVASIERDIEGNLNSESE